ncbi:MAG TPA: glycosyltransferase [Puia sp.]|nr:glycosyltransferase [Puia sp.]
MIRIKREKAWLGHFVVLEGLDLVISDNRYGLTTPGIPCIFITHQLLIKTPFGLWADRLLQTLNYRAIRHFSRCWIPDVATGGLAGDLSHPWRMPSIPTRYIGWLSRFGSPEPGDGPGSPAGGIDPGIAQAPRDRNPDLAPAPRGGGSPESRDGGDSATPGDRSLAGAPLLLALLSGPEPGRSLLEKDILRQALSLAGKSPLCRLVIVRGLPGSTEPPSAQWAPAASRGSSAIPASPDQSLPPWLTIHNHLPAKALEPLLRAASLVLARPGYSTVMDLERLGKRALFIPTPGQTEQEYLGPYLAAKGWAACVDQRAFSLAKALEMAVTAGSTRERQAEDPSVLAAEIKDVLDQSCPPALG